VRRDGCPGVARAISRRGRVCSLLLARPRRRARERRHVREASTRSIVVPAAVAAVVETTTVHRAVDGFSCGGYKVQHDPKKRETKKRERERERELTWDGCRWIPLRGRRWPDATLDVALYYTPSSPKRNKAQSRWADLAILRAWLSGRSSPVILSCTGFYGPWLATWPILPTQLVRYWFKKKEDENASQEVRKNRA